MLGEKRADTMVVPMPACASFSCACVRMAVFAIVIARFVPIVRTLAPITAGAARMSYGAFTLFNVIGAVVWGVGLTLLGYGLGQFEIIQKLLEPIFILIALASVTPMFIEWYKRRRAAKRAAAGEPAPEA